MLNNFPLLSKLIRILIILALVLFILSFLIALIFAFPVKHVLRTIYGALYVLFLPGFIWSYVFFPSCDKQKTFEQKNCSPSIKNQNTENQNKPLDVIERLTLSFALSMAMGPLLIFFLNKIGIKINFTNSFLELLTLIIAGLIIIFFQEKYQKSKIEKLKT